MEKSILAFKLIRLGIGMKLRSLLRLRTSKKIFGNWYNIITRFSTRLASTKLGEGIHH